MYLPIRYAPSEIELTIVSDADEPERSKLGKC